MSGTELAVEVRRARPELPVLYVTGYTDDRILLEQLESNHVDLLRKPYTRTALAQRVRDAIDRSAEVPNAA
jgi:two-component system cell cycle sensor histidine kinase/response regulator CckA